MLVLGVDEDGGDGRAISCTSKSVQRGKSRELGENMIVKAERTGEAPEPVGVIGQNVWLRKNIETSTREVDLNDSDTVTGTVYRYDEVHFVDYGFPTVESVRESFDELWSVHAADGCPIPSESTMPSSGWRRSRHLLRIPTQHFSKSVTSWEVSSDGEDRRRSRHGR